MNEKESMREEGKSEINRARDRRRERERGVLWPKSAVPCCRMVLKKASH